MPKNKGLGFALTEAYVEMIHDVLVSVFWAGEQPTASREYRNSHLLGSAVARPFQTAFGQEIHGDIFEKGAALFHSLVTNHPFQNGNKRTAVMALDHFLLANGYFLALPNSRMYEVAKQTATYRESGVTHEESLRRIVEVLKLHTISIRRLGREPGLRSLYEIALERGRIARRHALNKSRSN